LIFRRTRFVSRRRAMQLGVALLFLTLTLPAYGFTLASEAPTGTARHAAVKQLVIDTQYDQRTADPARDASITGRYIRGSAYDTLTTFRARKVNGRLTVSLSKPSPWLAESWKSNKAGNVWTFVLRKGVRFSDGKPLRAADVVFSLRRIGNVKSAPAFITNTFASVTAVNARTVRIVTKQPNPAIPYLLAYRSACIVNSVVAKQNGATDADDAATADTAQSYFDSHSLGSGPYILQTFSNVDQSVLVRNPRFWGPKPYYDRIVFRNVKPEIARLDVQSGQADVAVGLTPDQASSMSRAKVFRTPSTTVFYLQANASSAISPLAASPNLWKALRYGLDYPQLVKLAGGGASQSCGLVPRQFLGALPRKACVKRNLAVARAAVRATGVANPSLTLEFPTDFTLDGLSFVTLAQAIQSQLKEIGLETTLRGAPLATWLPRWMGGLQELNVGALTALYPDPNMTDVYLPTGYRGQYAGYKPDDAPALTALGVRAQQTIDPKKRAALYQQLQERLNAQSPFVPILQPSSVVVASSKVRNLVINPAYVIDPATLR
jgi:peptide/nickel transport system substrate-binding protein